MSWYRWRLQTTDESSVPLSINCWPSASGRDSYVNIEYESTASFDLQDVTIAIPLPALASPPRVKNVSPTALIHPPLVMVDEDPCQCLNCFGCPACSDEAKLLSMLLLLVPPVVRVQMECVPTTPRPLMGICLHSIYIHCHAVRAF